ncbi:MAG: efflux RND transporter periplasmic adaptor subunit [Inhella sp.]
MSNISRKLIFSTPVVLAILGVAVSLVGPSANSEPDATPPAAKPALAVTTTSPVMATLPMRVQANGNIAAWQEASVGTEVNGLRLADVKVNVGDVVRKGQVLATFASAQVGADVAHGRAMAAESEAALAEAVAHAARALELKTSGAISEQQINQYLTAERMARARMEAAKATLQSQELRLSQTQVLAPDDGVISSRSATVGAVLPNGQELFRVIRKGRLEWRAEVSASELAKLKPGQKVTLTPSGGEQVAGTLRVVSPAVNTQTRNGLVYVDIPAAGSAKSGMFARGEIEIGSGGQALTLPQAAVQQRDGFNYVMRVGGDSKVVQTKVALGRRAGDRVEVLQGLTADAKVVATGGGFLGDGDLVQVVSSVKGSSKTSTPAAQPRN